MKDKKVQIGIIGLGGIATAHAYALGQFEDLCRIAAVCDIMEDRANSRAEELGARGYTSYGALLQDPRIEAVVITVPHASNLKAEDPHYEIALAALRNHKHVLVEKPMSLTAAHAGELVRLARQEGLILTTGENTRFVPGYLEAARRVQEGLLGQIFFVRTSIDGSDLDTIKRRGNWRFLHLQGGVILDIGIHTFYLLKWMFGGMRDIYADAYRVVPEGVPEDSAVFTGRLVNGSYYLSSVSTIAKVPWTERLEIYGSRGAIIVDHLSDPPVRLYQGPDDRIRMTAVNSIQSDVSTSDYQKGWKLKSIVAEDLNFIQAIQGKCDLEIDAQDVVYSIQAVESAFRSVQTGKPVSLEN